MLALSLATFHIELGLHFMFMSRLHALYFLLHTSYSMCMYLYSACFSGSYIHLMSTTQLDRSRSPTMPRILLVISTTLLYSDSCSGHQSVYWPHTHLLLPRIGPLKFGSCFSGAPMKSISRACHGLAFWDALRLLTLSAVCFVSCLVPTAS